MDDPEARASAPAAGEDDAAQLAALLPAGAQRCVVARPGRLAERERPLAGLLSQTDRLPWGLNLEVRAYARAEVSGVAGRRHTLEFVRFAAADAPAIRAELARVEERRLDWGEQPEACADELTCTPVRARFIDPQTVAIETGAGPESLAHGARPCSALLAQEPRAIEVSARERDVPVGAPELLGTEVVLRALPDGLERVTRRRFRDPASAARALRQTLSGREDLPMLAGIPVQASSTLADTAVVQRASVGFEDLWLSLEDQARVRAALTEPEGGPDLEAPIEVQDADRVRRHVDDALQALPQLDAATQRSELTRLEQLLVRARREHPHHDGLARRHYQLRSGALGNPRGALEIAEAQLAVGTPDPRYWELAKRAALARVDPARLRAELMRSHGLSAQVARNLARELEQHGHAGHDYERAEWAALTAHGLAQWARAQRRAHVADTRVPLAELPRLVAYWARLSPDHAPGDLGVHVLAQGEREPSFRADSQPVWVADTQAFEREASVFAAATWDDAQLLAEGRAMRGRFRPGPLELALVLEPIAAGPSRARRRAGVWLRGRLEGDDLVIEQVSHALINVRWELLERYLAAPLAGLRGAVFPPDELVIEARTPDEAELAARAARAEPKIACAVDGSAVRCHGDLDDARAASRALVLAARALLGREARALWSGAD